MKIGEKIKHLRIQNSLTQEELAGRVELTKGFISQLERDLTSPSIATLVDILQCLGTDLKDFFNENTEEKVVFGREDIFTQGDRDGKNEIRWLVPNSQKHSMEPIIVELEPEGSTVPDNPHDGEEFGYCLSGSIFLYLGSLKYRVKKDESFYFKPTAVHYIANAGKKKAEVLWVSTPPSF